MTDALDKAFAEADNIVIAAKSAAPSVPAIVTASAGYSTHPLSITQSRAQLDELRGWVWACVRLVAQKIAGQVLCVGRPPSGKRYKSIGKRVEPLDDHPILDLLRNPNPYYSGWQLLFMSICSLEVTGRSLWYVEEGDGDRPPYLYFIPTPWIYSISPTQDSWTIRPTHSTSEWTLPGGRVINLHYPSPDGYGPNEVISPLARVSEAALTDRMLQKSEHAFFKNGVVPTTVLTAGRLPGMNGMQGERPVFTPQQRADLFAAMRSAFNGVLSNGEPIIIDGLIESITRYSQNAVEMDFPNSGKIIKSRILESYGVSEALLGNLLNANRASAVVSQEVLVYQKINPMLEMLSATLTQKLGPMFVSPREKLVVWFTPAVPNDAENEIKKYEIAAKLGFITKSEFRIHLLNLPAEDDGGLSLQPIGFLPAEPKEQSNDDDSNDDNKPEKRLNGQRRITITAN